RITHNQNNLFLRTAIAFYFISIKCQNDSVISLLSFILSLPTLPAFMPVFFYCFFIIKASNTYKKQIIFTPTAIKPKHITH
ncbi:hypothetical protein SEEH1381_09751, partial [Salmonella enterica subsp. enterica serovar Heidelberg str. 21381]